MITLRKLIREELLNQEESSVDPYFKKRFGVAVTFGEDSRTKDFYWECIQRRIRK